MTLPDPPARHDFVWLGPTWRTHLLTRSDAADEALLAGWIEAAHPLVIARRQPGDGPDTLRLGLALPDKRRIGLHIRLMAISRRQPPPSLRAVAAPVSWAPTLAMLDGTDARVYGSLAWAALTGLDYVRPDQSDLDLLFDVPDRRRLETLTQTLAPLCLWERPRLDGEFLLPGGLAIAWREWLGGGTQVLVKGMDRVFLASRQSSLADLQGEAA
jgi:phosphoribosyl-dephospho-CoA transferase